MDNRVSIGIIVGVIITIGSIIYNSTKFTINQKRFLILFLIFPPIGIPLIIAVLIYNRAQIGKEKNQHEIINSSKPIVKQSNSFNSSEKKIIISNKLNSSESEFEQSLENLDEKINLLVSAYKNGLFTESEFQDKKKYLESEKEKISASNIKKQNVQNIIQRNKNTFDELDELMNTGLITKEEHLQKRETLISIFEKREIDEFLNYSNLNENNNVISEVDALVKKTESKIKPSINDEKIRTSFKRLVILLFILISVILGIYLFRTILFSENSVDSKYEKENSKIKDSENKVGIHTREEDIVQNEKKNNKPTLYETQNWLVSKLSLYLVNESSYLSTNSSSNYYEVANYNLKYLNVYFDDNYLVVKYNYKVDIINTDVQSRFIDSDLSISKEEWVNRHKVSKKTTRDDNISVYIPVELVSRTFYSTNKNATGSYEFYIWTKDEKIIFKNETTGITEYSTVFTCKIDYPKDEKNMANRIDSALKFLKENTPKKSNNKNKEPF